MRLVTLNSCTRIVAVALLVASAFSAGLRHAHPGGNLTHAHHAEDWASSGAVASLGLAAPLPAELQLLAAEAHMHVYLFGFEFTVPTKDESKDHPSRSTEMLVARLVGDAFDVSLDSTANDWQAPLAAAPTLALSTTDAMVGAMTPIVANSPPLCDSARHERTGVLRI
jgi:hypothetical protein